MALTHAPISLAIPNHSATCSVVLLCGEIVIFIEVVSENEETQINDERSTEKSVGRIMMTFFEKHQYPVF